MDKEVVNERSFLNMNNQSQQETSTEIKASYNRTGNGSSTVHYEGINHTGKEVKSKQVLPKRKKKTTTQRKQQPSSTSSSSHTNNDKQLVLPSIHLVYNPYLVKLIYSKTYYFHKSLLHHLPHLSWENHDAMRDLMVNQHYTEIMINDVILAERVFNKDRFMMDIYYCNFEYALYRLTYLQIDHQLRDPLSPPPECIFGELHQGKESRQWDHYEMGGGYFTCEVTTSSSIQTNKKSDLIVSLIRRYVNEFYFNGWHTTQETIVKRRKLKERIQSLHRIKLFLEKTVDAAQSSKDYCIDHDEESAMSLLYIYFLSEFVGFLQSDLYKYQSSSHVIESKLNLSYLFGQTDNPTDGNLPLPVSTPPLIDPVIVQLTENIVFLQELLSKIKTLLVYSHFAWITTEPELRKRNGNDKQQNNESSPSSRLPPNLFNHHYSERTPPKPTSFPLNDPTYVRFVQISSLVQSRHGSIRYMNLIEYKNEYESLIMAILFNLTLSSRHKCTSTAISTLGNCSICRYYYLLRDKELHDAIVRCSSLHYMRKSMEDGKSRKQRQELDQYLQYTMIKRIEPFEARIFKNIFMISTIMRDTVIIFDSYKERYDPSNDPFLLFDIQVLINDMKIQNDSRTIVSTMDGIHLFVKSLKYSYLKQKTAIVRGNDKVYTETIVNKSNVIQETVETTTTTTTTSELDDTIPVINPSLVNDENTFTPVVDIPIDTFSTSTTTTTSTTCISQTTTVHVEPITSKGFIVMEEDKENEVVVPLDTTSNVLVDVDLTTPRLNEPNSMNEKENEEEDIQVELIDTMITMNLELDISIFFYFLDAIYNQIGGMDKVDAIILTPQTGNMDKDTPSLSFTTKSSRQLIRDNVLKVYGYYLRMLCTEFQ